MPNTSLDDTIRNLAQQAVDTSRDRFQTTLDYSEESLEHVERILSQLHRARPKGLIAGLVLGRLLHRGPSQRQIQVMGAVWGAYVGEVIKARWGGEWRRIGRSGPGPRIALRVRGKDLFPAAQAAKRLTQGARFNVWDYYQDIKSDFEGKGK